MGKKRNTAFCYLGLGLKELKNSVSLDQTHYIKLLDTVNLQDENLYIRETWQSPVGKLISISGQTRPDISLDVGHLASNHLNSSILADVEHLNHVTSHLKQLIVSLMS